MQHVAAKLSLPVAVGSTVNIQYVRGLGVVTGRGIGLDVGGVGR